MMRDGKDVHIKAVSKTFFPNRELLIGRSCTVAKPLSLCERMASHTITMTIRASGKAMVKV